MTILVLIKSPQRPSCHKDALAQDLVRTAVMALSPYLVLAQSCISPVLQISGPCKGFGQDRVRRTQSSKCAPLAVMARHLVAASPFARFERCAMYSPRF